MRYISTRGGAPACDFAGALLAGLAEDGGLYVPDSYPVFSAAEFRAMRGLAYPELAARILTPFAEGAIGRDTLGALCRAAYAGFTHPAVVPLRQLDHAVWVQELFHGPTLAFKDIALQLLARLFDHVLARDERRLTLLAATSGDTGPAAIAACRGRARLGIVVLHPAGQPSAVQRRQMTTVADANVANLAIEGTFDDCQDLVKAMFADAPFRAELGLSAVNSINWARIAAQIPYYVFAALALGAPDRAVSFSVPSGNFGNAFAAYVAARIGLPITRVVVATNHNDVLARLLAAGELRPDRVRPSLSPSMDIAVSSNFERLLFDLLGRDPGATAAAMRAARATGRLALPAAALDAARALFAGFTLDDPGTLAEIGRLTRDCAYLADPHSAIGIAGAARWRNAGPVVALATAHPAKFPDAVAAATGRPPPLPPAIADLYEREERYDVLPNRLDLVQARVRATVRNAA